MCKCRFNIKPPLKSGFFIKKVSKFACGKDVFLDFKIILKAAFNSFTSKNAY